MILQDLNSSTRSTMTVSKLRRFAEEILRCVDILENDCLSRGVDVPDIDDPQSLDNDFERSKDSVLNAANSIVASALALVHSVQSPIQSMRCVASGVRRFILSSFVFFVLMTVR